MSLDSLHRTYITLDTLLKAAVGEVMILVTRQVPVAHGAGYPLIISYRFWIRACNESKLRSTNQVEPGSAGAPDDALAAQEDSGPGLIY